MTGRQAMYRHTAAQRSRLVPIQLHQPFRFVAPVLEMFAHTQRTHHLTDTPLQARHRPVIQMVPMVMRNHQAIYIRHIFRTIDIRPRKRLIQERYRSGTAKHGVYQNTLAAQLKQIGRMPEPYQKLPIRVECTQIRLHRRNRMFRTQSFRRLFENEIQHGPPFPLFQSHQDGRFHVTELPVPEIRRPLDTFQPFATRQTPERRRLKEKDHSHNRHGNDTQYDEQYLYHFLPIHVFFKLYLLMSRQR